MFNVGDRVKCIKTGSITIGEGNIPALVKNREYIIYGINSCTCKTVILDVGLTVRTYNGNLSCSCGIKTPHNGIHWCASVRFVKIQEKKKYITVASTVEVNEEELIKN